jgi:mRNA interferase RelE/StbE
VHRLEITRKAQRQLDRLPNQTALRVKAAIQQLTNDPRPPGAVKMADMQGGWRIRVGDYRVVYEIHDDRLVVLIIRVGHRRDVYR